MYPPIIVPDKNILYEICTWFWCVRRKWSLNLSDIFNKIGAPVPVNNNEAIWVDYWYQPQKKSRTENMFIRLHCIENVKYKYTVITLVFLSA